MKTFKTMIHLFFVVALLFVSASAKEKKPKQIDCSAKLQQALIKFNKAKFSDAKTMFDEMKISCSGHTTMDSILYYLAKSNIKLKLPAEARVELEVLVQDYPETPFKEEAAYLIGCTYYMESPIYERDQGKTREAIRQFEQFNEEHPGSPYRDSVNYFLNLCIEKLAKKEFMTASFYDIIQQYEAAIIYYRAIMADYPQSTLIPETVVNLAQDLMLVSRTEEAKQILDSIKEQSYYSRIKDKVELIQNKLDQAHQ